MYYLVTDEFIRDESVERYSCCCFYFRISDILSRVVLYFVLIIETTIYKETLWDFRIMAISYIDCGVG